MTNGSYLVEGEFKTNQTTGGGIEREGQGSHHLSNGVVYSGQWRQDKMNGKGKMTHPNGSTYEVIIIDWNELELTPLLLIIGRFRRQ